MSKYDVFVFFSAAVFLLAAAMEITSLLSPILVIPLDETAVHHHCGKRSQTIFTIKYPVFLGQS